MFIRRDFIQWVATNVRRGVSIHLIRVVCFSIISYRLLFLIARLLPLTLHLNSILLKGLHSTIMFIPRRLRLLISDFLFLFPNVKRSRPFIVFSSTCIRKYVIKIKSSFSSSPNNGSIRRTRDLPNKPIRGTTPITMARRTFASFTQTILITTIIMWHFQVISFRRSFRRYLCLSLLRIQVFCLLLRWNFQSGRGAVLYRNLRVGFIRFNLFGVFNGNGPFTCNLRRTL